MLADYERRNRLIAPIVRRLLSWLAGFRYDCSDAARRRLVDSFPVLALRPKTEGSRLTTYYIALTLAGEARAAHPTQPGPPTHGRPERPPPARGRAARPATPRSLVARIPPPPLPPPSSPPLPSTSPLRRSLRSLSPSLSSISSSPIARPRRRRTPSLLPPLRAPPRPSAASPSVATASASFSGASALRRCRSLVSSPPSPCWSPRAFPGGLWVRSSRATARPAPSPRVLRPSCASLLLRCTPPRPRASRARSHSVPLASLSASPSSWPSLSRRPVSCSPCAFTSLSRCSLPPSRSFSSFASSLVGCGPPSVARLSLLPSLPPARRPLRPLSRARALLALFLAPGPLPAHLACCPPGAPAPALAPLLVLFGPDGLGVSLSPRPWCPTAGRAVRASRGPRALAALRAVALPQLPRPRAPPRRGSSAPFLRLLACFLSSASPVPPCLPWSPSRLRTAVAGYSVAPPRHCRVANRGTVACVLARQPMA